MKLLANALIIIFCIPIWIFMAAFEIVEIFTHHPIRCTVAAMFFILVAMIATHEKFKK